MLFIDPECGAHVLPHTADQKRRAQAKKCKAAAGPKVKGNWGPERYIADTGCPYDLIGQQDVHPADRKNIEQADEPISMDTANGPSDIIDKVLPLQSRGLWSVVKPYVMPNNSPAVLAVGRRCMLEGVFLHLECLHRTQARPP